MNRILLFVLMISALNVVKAQNFWRPADEEVLMVTRDIERDIFPEKYETLKLDLDGLVNYLKKAPAQFNKAGATLPVYIPMPDGSSMLFDVVNSPCMMPGLANKFPQIISFKGFSRDNPNINIRFDIGEYGFHASIYWKGKNVYIDPYSKGIKDYYISYFTHDYKLDISDVNLKCGTNTDDVDIMSADYDGAELDFRDDIEGNCDTILQYNYKLALGCTGEWGQRRGTVEKAMSDINTAVNRINQIYENEFSIHLNLIDDNDKVIWLDPNTDPFDKANSGHGLLGEVTKAYNKVLNYKSYDIGHIFTNSCTDVGGVASLSSVCNDFSKAQGVTCHYLDDLNYIVTNVTCHEMGHQFSAAHTFNNCGGNESSFGFEPGGGTTIMAYCGLCGPNNVDYPCLETFHAFSIEQVKYYSRVSTHCAKKISKGNTEPVAILNYTDGFFIPISTPFYLEGEGYDCEGDELSFSWEEMDVGPQSPIGQPVGNAPLFTVREPTDKPYRYFPELYSILYQQSNNSEILPDYGRDLNFRFIVRDNHDESGGTDWADVSFKVDSTSGPFKVTYPNSTLSFGIGTALTVKWDVANTDNSFVNCKKVDIELSLDKGYNYDYILKYHTDNDGSETVYLPDSITNNARLRVKASDNIFFDVSNYNIHLVERQDTSYSFDLENLSGEICMPMNLDSKVKTLAFNGYEDSIRFEITGLPDNATYTFEPAKVKAGESTFLKFDLSEADTAGYFVINVLAISDGGDTVKREINWQYYSNDYDKLRIVSPVPGSSGVVLNPVFEWEKPTGVDYVNIYISKNPAFPATATISKKHLEGTSCVVDEVLDYSSLYYWKLEFVNSCGTISVDTIYTFSTLSLECKGYFSDREVYIKTNKTVSSDLEVEDDFVISYISVTMKGIHQYFKEIKASLVAPDSTRVLLFGYKPFNYNGNFNLTFDMNASATIKSPPKGTFKPDGDMSVLIDKNAKGVWNLEVTDKKNSNNNGLLKYFGLKICGPLTPTKPVLENNDLLKIPLNAAWTLPPENLKVVDPVVNADGLIYTLVKLPVKSEIRKNGITLNIGDTFTQQDINEGRIKLYYAGDEIIRDRFYFTVFNGKGGWIDITPFYFESDPTIDKTETIISDIVKIYPNPALDYVYIDISIDDNFDISVYDMEGKRYFNEKTNGNMEKRLDISNLAPGVYLIKVSSSKHNYYKKIVKQ